ncbi:unnamed protein product [Heterobilharzia americana]|nr:unnamed protein product [Heterobilharzia americana]
MSTGDSNDFDEDEDTGVHQDDDDEGDDDVDDEEIDEEDDDGEEEEEEEEGEEVNGHNFNTNNDFNLNNNNNNSHNNKRLEGNSVDKPNHYYPQHSNQFSVDLKQCSSNRQHYLNKEFTQEVIEKSLSKFKPSQLFLLSPYDSCESTKYITDIIYPESNYEHSRNFDDYSHQSLPHNCHIQQMNNYAEEVNFQHPIENTTCVNPINSSSSSNGTRIHSETDLYNPVSYSSTSPINAKNKSLTDYLTTGCINNNGITNPHHYFPSVSSGSSLSSSAAFHSNSAMNLMPELYYSDNEFSAHRYVTSYNSSKCTHISSILTNNTTTNMPISSSSESNDIKFSGNSSIIPTTEKYGTTNDNYYGGTQQQCTIGNEQQIDQQYHFSQYSTHQDLVIPQSARTTNTLTNIPLQLNQTYQHLSLIQSLDDSQYISSSEIPLANTNISCNSTNILSSSLLTPSLSCLSLSTPSSSSFGISSSSSSIPKVNTLAEIPSSTSTVSSTSTLLSIATESTNPLYTTSKSFQHFHLKTLESNVWTTNYLNLSIENTEKQLKYLEEGEKFQNIEH